MDVRCERCRAEYVFEDEQVTPAGLAVQCTNCGHLFRVKKKELVVTVAMRPGDVEGTPMPATAAAPRSHRPRPAPSSVRAAAPALPPLPAHEIDLGPDEEMMTPRRGRSRRWIAAALAAAAAGAGASAYLLEPGLFRSRPPPPVPTPAVAKVERPPEPPPAPTPVVEPVPVSAPEPIVKPAVKQSARSAKEILAQASRLREGGNVEGALDLYGRVAAEDPENAEALTGRGLCYLDLASYAPAVASFKAALRLAPRDPDALLGLAETYRFEGNKAEAVRQYERYLAAHPAGDEADVARNAIADLRE
jgi:predicted Zn finger-like uncharacterized protein